MSLPQPMKAQAPDLAAAVRAADLAGELACLVRLAHELAKTANEEAEPMAAWRLQALLSAMEAHANALHDTCATAVERQGGAR